MDGIRFIEELAEVTIGPNGVKVRAYSDSEPFCFRFDLELWRLFLGREVARLQEYDRAQGERVVPFKKPRGH